jgi:hypothetical protein
MVPGVCSGCGAEVTIPQSTQDRGQQNFIKFLFGGLEWECVPRMMPESQMDTVALENLIIEYVDNVQKQWKPLLLMGMQMGIPQVALTKLVGDSPLLMAAISYKTSCIRDTASAMIYVNDSIATIADAYGEIPATYSTAKAQMTYPPQGSAAAREGTAPVGTAIEATRSSPPASSRAASWGMHETNPKCIPTGPIHTQQHSHDAELISGQNIGGTRHGH